MHEAGLRYGDGQQEAYWTRAEHEAWLGGVVTRCSMLFHLNKCHVTFSSAAHHHVTDRREGRDRSVSLRPRWFCRRKSTDAGIFTIQESFDRLLIFIVCPNYPWLSTPILFIVSKSQRVPHFQQTHPFYPPQLPRSLSLLDYISPSFHRPCTLYQDPCFRPME